MSEPNGGQAFPMPQRDDALKGMSLRDFFATAAMQATIGKVENLDVRQFSSTELTERIARVAYRLADAMLNEKAMLESIGK